MEGHRRYDRRYDDPGSRWYGGSAYESGGQPTDDEHRASGQRYSVAGVEPFGADDPFGTGPAGEPGTGRLSEPGTGRLSEPGDTGVGGFSADGAEVRAAHEPMRFPLRSNGSPEAARSGGRPADPVVVTPLVPPSPSGTLPSPSGTLPSEPVAPWGVAAGRRGGPAPAGGAGLVPGQTSEAGVTYGSGAALPGSPAAGPTGLLPPLPADAGRRPDEAVYATRRPAVGLLLVVLVALLAVPAVRLFAAAAFADRPVAREIVPACLLLLGLPLTGMGLWALANGGRVGDRGAWLRPPVGFLTVGLVLLAAALATG